MLNTVIAIPYRDRRHHLDHFLKHAWPLISSTIPRAALIIVEQEAGKSFNRGALMNIAFKEQGSQAEWFMTHDVDVSPSKSAVRDVYTLETHDVIRIYNGHDSSLGGICKFSAKTFEEANGFPNHIWGWGIEDRVMFYRCNYIDARITPHLRDDTQYTTLPHPCNGRAYEGETKRINEEEIAVWNSKDKETQLAHKEKSGLRAEMPYTVLERKQLAKDVLHIRVRI